MVESFEKKKLKKELLQYDKNDLIEMFISERKDFLIVLIAFIITLFALLMVALG